MNRVTASLAITSNTTWFLSVSDPNHGAARGHMTSGSKRLIGPLSATGPSGAVVSLVHGGSLGDGFGSLVVPVELRQRVVAKDRAGTYGITLSFQVIAGF